MGMLALDDEQRNAFVRHFDGVRAPKLVGAKRRRTLAARAVSRKWVRIPAGAHGRPQVGPRMTENSAPTGRRERVYSHGSRCSNPPADHPDLASLPPLPLRTSTASRVGSISLWVSASASLIRMPAFQSTMTTPRSLIASGSFLAPRMTAMISSTVGGSGG
jgi:hypothetical protein